MVLWFVDVGFLDEGSVQRFQPRADLLEVLLRNKDPATECQAIQRLFEILLWHLRQMDYDGSHATLEGLHPAQQYEIGIWVCSFAKIGTWSRPLATRRAMPYPTTSIVPEHVTLRAAIG